MIYCRGEIMEKSEEQRKADFADLVALMARLRSPEGCPWDHAQTPETLTPYIVEEAYELVEAATSGERVHEAADLLYHALALLAAENVPLDDVLRALQSRRR